MISLKQMIKKFANFQTLCLVLIPLVAAALCIVVVYGAVRCEKGLELSPEGQIICKIPGKIAPESKDNSTFIEYAGGEHDRSAPTAKIIRSFVAICVIIIVASTLCICVLYSKRSAKDQQGVLFDVEKMLDPVVVHKPIYTGNDTSKTLLPQTEVM